MWSKKRIVWFVLMLATMAVIFYFSGQPKVDSSKIGNIVGEAIKITPDKRWRTPSTTPLLFGLNLRKWAHVYLYMILGITVMETCQKYVNTFVICYSYAASDEIHQYFIEGRTATIQDTLLDACGFLTALLLWFLCSNIWNFIKNRYIESRRKNET